MDDRSAVDDLIAQIEELVAGVENGSPRIPALRKRAGDCERQLVEHLTKRRMEFRNRGENARERRLLEVLHEVLPQNWFIFLHYCLVVSRDLGSDAAAAKFAGFVRTTPVFTHQIGSDPQALRVATILTIGKTPMSFKDDGFKLPAGMTESKHLTASPAITSSLVFLEGARVETLRGFDVVFNAVSDIDIFAEEIRSLREIADSAGVSVVNIPKPDATCRHVVAEALEGLPETLVPRTVKIRIPADRGAVGGSIRAAGIAFPLLVRPVGSQTGQGLTLLATGAEASRFDAAPGDYYVTAFHDFRSRDGFYRKYRVWNIGDDVLQNHMFIHTDWNVHGTSRMQTMRHHRWMPLEEQVFLEKPLDERVVLLARTLREATGLAYFGIDYGYHPDGRLLFFEANATMRSHYPEWRKDFPYVEKVGAHHIRLFQRMIAARARR